MLSSRTWIVLGSLSGFHFNEGIKLVTRLLNFFAPRHGYSYLPFGTVVYHPDEFGARVYKGSLLLHFVPLDTGSQCFRSSQARCVVRL